MKKINLLLQTIALASPFSLTAQAEPYQGMHPLLSDRFVISAIGFWPEIDSTISVDDPDGDSGSDVDFDKIFGSDAGFRAALTGQWRLSERSVVSLEWFSVGSDGKATLDETIDWGDMEYQVGTMIKAESGLDVYRAFYGYNFYRDDNKEIGIGAGLHLMNIQAELSGSATVDGVPVGNAKHSVDEWAPLPNIGLYANYAFSPKWLVSGQVDWFSANVGDYEGDLWNVGGFVQYQMLDNFGVGVGYRFLEVDLKVDKKGEWMGNANTGYDGAVLFVTGNF